MSVSLYLIYEFSFGMCCVHCTMSNCQLPVFSRHKILFISAMLQTIFGRAPQGLILGPFLLSCTELAHIYTVLIVA